jgi:DNA replication and repair protein RecF
MIIKSLKLVNFRNYSDLECEFQKGINFIYGDNATGKTNLVESIYCLSIARSFRTNITANLINNKNQQAYIKAKIDFNGSNKCVEIILSENSKTISIEGKKVSKLSELNKMTNCIYFVPKDVDLLRDSPKDRRFFLNVNVSKENSSYLEEMSSYEKLLKERNNLLKNEKVNMNLIEVLTNQMITLSKNIYSERKSYIDKLNVKFKDIYNQISGNSDNVKMIYMPFIKDFTNYESLAKEAYKNSLENDLKNKITGIGIHKEDFFVVMNGKNLAKFGSQGENRMAVLALKMCPYFLIDDDKLKPVVILDDVLSELDKNHERLLLTFLNSIDQVFITSTKKYEINNATYYQVSGGKIIKGA